MKVTPIFEKNYNALLSKNYKYIINSGSSRSSKTFSILQLFWVLCWSNERIKCSAFRITKKDCKDTILQDMLKYYPTLPNWDKVIFNKSESYFTFPNGSQIYIEGTDDELKVMGYHSDYLWFNEFYKLSKETFDQLDMRCNVAVFMDYNPVGNHWADDVMKRDNAFVIHSTFKDNPFCPVEQKKKILSYEPTEYNIKQGTANEYNWQVFGLGLKAEKQGRIYNWKPISYLDYLNIEKQTYYGCDWGLVDPWGIVEVKYHDGNLYVHELNYKSENEIRRTLTTTELHQINASQDEGLVSWMFTKLNIPKDKIIVCDSNRPTKIIALRRSGWEYAVSVGGKTRLLDRIGTMQSLNVYYTSTSKNIEFEQENYSYQKDRFGVTLENPEDGNDHCFDGNTLINTIDGLKKIKNIETTDFVLTTNGYQKVIKKFNNGVKKINVYRLQLDTFFIYLHCTENHKIKIGEQWIQAKDLCNHLTEEITICMTEKDILVNQTKDYTLLNGNSITEKFLKDFTYTTKTEILKTIKLKISKLLKEKNICVNTELKELKKIKRGSKILMKKAEKKLKNGTLQKMELNGIENTQLNATLEILHTDKKNARFAKKNILQKQKIMNFVQENAYLKTEETQELTISKENVLFANQNLPLINIQKLQLVGVRVEQSYNTNVWDIMVNNNHEYFANGVLVHNCINAIEYIAQKLFEMNIIKNI